MGCNHSVQSGNWGYPAFCSEGKADAFTCTLRKYLCVRGTCFRFYLYWTLLEVVTCRIFPADIVKWGYNEIHCKQNIFFWPVNLKLPIVSIWVTNWIGCFIFRLWSKYFAVKFSLLWEEEVGESYKVEIAEILIWCLGVLCKQLEKSLEQNQSFCESFIDYTGKKVLFKHFHSMVLPEEAKSITLRLWTFCLWTWLS